MCKISNQGASKDRVKALKIEFIANSEELGRLIGFSIDVLEFCTEDGLSSLRVAGWIAARAATVNTIRIHSGYGGTRYGTAFLEVNVPRSDVVAAFPGGDISENCGFQGVLPVEGLGENFSLIVLAAQTNTRASAETLFLVGEILGRQQPSLPTPISSSLAPICLTCMGRTGSTALMRILNMHPEIVVAGDYPFETKYAETAVRGALVELKVLLSEGVACIGLKAPYGRLYAETRGHIFRAALSAIDLFYECTVQAQKKGDVKYFAEKCLPSFLPDITRDLYGSKAKEIILIRDPRDIFCSAKSFNRRRGYLSFGAENVHSDADLFRHFRYGFLIWLSAASGESMRSSSAMRT